MQDSLKTNSDESSKDIQEDKDLFGNRPIRIVVFVYFAAFVCIACYIWLLFFRIECTPDSKAPYCAWNTYPEFLGQFGDFFGGALNPIVGLVTVYLLFVSIKIQRHELAETRKELASSRVTQENQSKLLNHQSFEQSFFARMSNYREILNSISFSKKEYADQIISYNYKLFEKQAIGKSENHFVRPLQYVNLTGVGALAGLWDFEKSKRTTFNVADGPRSHDDILELYNHLENNSETESDQAESLSYKTNALFGVISESWFYFYKENRLYIDSLFKSLFELINWVDKRTDLDATNRWQYIELVLAQLTILELDILFHYGLFSAPAEHRALYEKVALLRDINSQDIIVKFIDIYRESLPDHYEYIVFDRDSAFVRYVK